MPIILEIVSHQKTYESLTETLIVNDIDTSLQENMDVINNLIMVKYTNDDKISMVPSCKCGKLKGQHHVGTICSYCKFPVELDMQKDISNLLWFRRPEGIQKLISPLLINLLESRFGMAKGKESIISYFMLKDYKLTPKHLEKFNEEERVKLFSFPRGYNAFIQNFDSIMEFLFSVTKFKMPKVKKRNPEDYLEETIQLNRDDFFSDYIPFPNRTMIVYETTEVGKFIDPKLVGPIDVLRRLTGFSYLPHSEKTKEKIIASSLLDLAKFYKDHTSHYLSPKEGLIRHHVMSTRTHFSARNVIVSITDQQRYDSLYIPWSTACTLFREHILNKLFKLGYQLNDALTLIYDHVENYSVILDSIFEELLEESNDGIPVVFHRNPCLLIGSMQKLRIRKIKKDPKDKTIGLPILIVYAYNADFDGDEMNLSLVLDEFMDKKTDRLQPHNSVFTMARPMKIGGFLSIPKPLISTISNWLTEPYKNHDTHV